MERTEVYQVGSDQEVPQRLEFERDSLTLVSQDSSNVAECDAMIQIGAPPWRIVS